MHGVGYPGWSQRSYAAVVDDEALDLFLIAGRDPTQLLERYTALTGRAPEVPPWSFGVWIAQNGDGSGDDVASAAALRARRVPCDVLSLDARLSWRWPNRRSLMMKKSTPIQRTSDTHHGDAVFIAIASPPSS